MRPAIICVLVLVAMATVEAGPMKKRFLLKEIQDALNSVGDWFTKTYNSAKDSFNKLASGRPSISEFWAESMLEIQVVYSGCFLPVNFDAAVNALIPYISSDMSVTACVGACENAATTVLGPAASLASTVCTPVCEGALAKLEDIAG
ncbi:conotoxin [Plakobranchus ocellatus]|uniref:Conotoxin n=1 Tax=Plakobranchus ocellatus TaxID=259542 RepID=A0AAV4AR54_9GAST|nr:conotoxin [Plakobranchus ocellatus]